MGLAALVAPGGVVSDSARNEITQRTLKGDFNGAITYVTGTPFKGSTQNVFKNLVDSIDRQGQVSEDLRNQSIKFLHGLAPTDLEQNRIDALEKNSLASYRDFGTTKATPQLQSAADKRGYSGDDLQKAIDTYGLDNVNKFLGVK
jgi:hypothetical protein